MRESDQAPLLNVLLRFPRLFWLTYSIKNWKPLPIAKYVPTGGAVASQTPFIFIIGSGRSGNTILRRLIMQKLDIFIPPESYVLPMISSYRATARGLAWDQIVDSTIKTFESHPEFKHFGVGDVNSFTVKAKSWNREYQNLTLLVKKFYIWIGEQNGLKANWAGDKTPKNTFFLKPISKLLPDSNFIFMLRDGVDVVQSYLDSGIYHEAETAARRWVYSFRFWNAFKNSLEPLKFIEIRFEDLITNPENELFRIENHFEIQKRNQEKDLRGKLGDGECLQHHRLSNKPVTASTAGKGRRKMDSPTKAKIRGILNPTLIKLGYEHI